MFVESSLKYEIRIKVPILSTNISICNAYNKIIVKQELSNCDSYNERESCQTLVLPLTVFNLYN